MKIFTVLISIHDYISLKYAKYVASEISCFSKASKIPHFVSVILLLLLSN